jgi:carbamate kinase
MNAVREPGLVVIAIGGNALLKPGETPTPETQRRHLRAAGRAIARIARGHDVVVTHGSGPQVGLLAQRSATQRPAYPLDIERAESEGMIGYMLDQAIANAMPGRDVATLITQVEVDPSDAAFAKPSQPVGPTYSKKEARRLAIERGWAVARCGAGYRRVVPAPEPRRILELQTIKLLVQAGIIVVCAGGGGIPVAISESGGVHGIEAVIDKDLAAALLAIHLRADALLLLTDVKAVYRGWGTAKARPIHHAHPGYLKPCSFEAASMRPKILAARRFAGETGGMAAIGALSDAYAILSRTAGTIIEAPRPHK